MPWGRREEGKGRSWRESDFGQFPEGIDSRDSPMESRLGRVVRVMELDAGVLDPTRHSGAWLSVQSPPLLIGGIS